MEKESIETIIEEQIWYAKLMLKDKGKKPYLHPLMEQINDPWEAVYWAMEDLKQNLKEANLWTDTHTLLNVQAGATELTAHTSN